MASSDKELEQQLMEAGNKLLQPPDSVDELLSLLDQVEDYLSRVEQSPTSSMQNALSPSRKALVSDKFVRHSDVDVKVAVASCISEITRITAPDAPYDDDQMKEVFQLIVSSLENLSAKSSRSYLKRTSILETVAKVRSCVVMLDLECDALIIEMFRHILEAIRDEHSENVISSMETIMTLVLEESEDISLELLSPILDCVKKDNEELLPIARKLGEKVLQSCASKVKPYLLQAVKSSGISLDDYSELVASICQETDEDESNSVKAPVDEATQADKEIATEAPSLEPVDPSNNKSPTSIVNNGMTQTGEDVSLADSSSLKKEEPSVRTNQSKAVRTASNSEPDSSVADKAVSAEDKPEQHTRKKGRKSISSMEVEEPSDSSQIDNEKETEAELDHISDDKEDHVSPHAEPTAKRDVPSQNEKETGIQVSSPNASEDESMDVASPTPSKSIPNESHAQGHGLSKKNDVSITEGTPADDDVSKKTSEGTSDSEATPPRLSGKKVPGESANDGKTPTVDLSKNEIGSSSDTEAKLLKQSGKKVDASSNNGDGSSLKQSHGKKRRDRAAHIKDSTRSSTKDDKEIVSTAKSAAKATKAEHHSEATSNSNSKRKRTPGKEKTPDIEEHAWNLVGSKVKVWWPKDRMYYKGVIESFDPVKKKHKVSYIDGDEEILNLKRERWEFIGDDSDSNEEQAVDRESPDPSLEMPLRKRANSTAERSRGKLENSAKKGGGASSSKSKSADMKSGRKSKYGIKAVIKSKDGSKTISENDNVSENKDQTLTNDNKSADVASKSASKSKDDLIATSKSGKSEGGSVTPKTNSKAKQETPKTSKPKQETIKITSSSKGKSPENVGKSDTNGTGKSKSGSTKLKQDEDAKGSTDSILVPDSSKGKSASPSKATTSEVKSGKKRRRGSKN